MEHIFSTVFQFCVYIVNIWSGSKKFIKVVLRQEHIILGGGGGFGGVVQSFSWYFTQKVL